MKVLIDLCDLAPEEKSEIRLEDGLVSEWLLTMNKNERRLVRDEGLVTDVMRRKLASRANYLKDRKMGTWRVRKMGKVLFVLRTN